MLVVDPTLKDANIVFRKSMKKFDCPNSMKLEIARTSKPGMYNCCMTAFNFLSFPVLVVLYKEMDPLCLTLIFVKVNIFLRKA